MEDRIQTLHPDKEKQGVNIQKSKYTAVRDAIISILRERGGTMKWQALGKAVEEKLDGNFEGSIGWYYTTVKLDLEARGILERIPNRTPQEVRLTE